jgi:TonB-linked SusC/RagA family outer membrane protein
MTKVVTLNRNRKRFQKIVLFLFVSTFPAWSQETITITGKIVDKYNDEAIIGATVRTQDGQSGTATDLDGEFNLNVSQLPVTLNISYIGYKSQEVDVYEANRSILVEMEDAKRLNEVVVVGYQQVKKSTQSSAATNVTLSAINDIPAASITDKLQGAVSGLLISQNSGVPGASSLVRLRGATSITAKNEPVYIIDGVMVSTDTEVQQVDLGGQRIDPLASINPDDIESITVLKDAGATAAYGARGANGVILITTKRGIPNQKTKVNFSTEFGFSQSPDLWDLVSGPEHAQIVNEYYKNNGQWDNRPFQEGAAYYGAPDNQKTYDRISPSFRTAFLKKYNASVSGGDTKTNFFIGGDLVKQEATLKLQDFERKGFRVNLDHNVWKNFKIGTSNLFSWTDRTLVRVGDGPSGFFQAALHTPTFYPIYNEDGSYYKPPKVAFDSPAAQLDHYNGHSYGQRNLHNIYGRWQITPDVSFKSSWSLDHNNYNEVFYYNSFLKDGQPNGKSRDANSTTNIYTEEQVLNYLKTFNDKHFFSAYLGHAFQESALKQTDVSASEFPADQLQTISSASVTSATGNGTESRLLSYFGGTSYTYDNRYTLDLTLRADASSRVGANNRWGYFPSLGLAWSPTREKFFPQTGWLNDLTLKSSLGLTGNDQVGDFAALGLWGSGYNYNGTPGLAPYQLGNPDLKWETTRQGNIGLFASLLNNRFDVEFNYYNKYTYDLLLAESVADKTGFSSITKNVGEISNKGIELQLTSTNIKKKNFNWKTTFAVSHNKNVVEKLPSSELQVPGNYDMFLHLQEGSPLYSIWVYNYLGVAPETVYDENGNVLHYAGDAVYEDVNKDKKITTEDKKIVADAWPELEGSIKNQLTYKNWSLDFSFYYKYGNHVFNYTRSFLESGGTRTDTRSIQASSLNYWKEENKDSYKVNGNGYITEVLPRPKANSSNPDGSSNYEQKSSRNVEDGSYIRFQNITLSYAFPRKWLSELKIQKASIYATANNIYLLTKYTGPDPDANIGQSPGTYGLVQGLDFGTPPAPRSFLLGVNLTF